MRRQTLNHFAFSTAADLLLTLIAYELAMQARYWLPFGVKLSQEQLMQPWGVYLLILAIWGIVFVVMRVQDTRLQAKPTREIQVLTWAILVACILLAGVLYISYRDVPRRLFLYFFLADWGLLALFRLALRAALRFASVPFNAPRRVLVVGTGQLAQQVMQGVRRQQGAGLELVGCITEEPTRQAAGSPVLGTLVNVPALVKQHRVDEVIFALPLRSRGVIESLVEALQSWPVQIRVVPDYLDLMIGRATVQDFNGLPMVGLQDVPTITSFDRIVKRIFDVVIGFVMTLVLAPLMALIALAIKWDSHGPVLFVQERIGENGRTFKMYKFRSMVVDADRMAGLVVRQNATGEIIHKSPNDPRVTRAGRFLRRSSLDELPQLFNVLRGEMSLVGPRPELPWLVDNYEQWQWRRFTVPPGMTGWWQINGRSERLMHLHTEDDLYYIQNYSPWLDVQIMWRTIAVVLRGSGAF